MVQRQASEGGMAATSDLEESIESARGSGQPLSDNIREPMEQALGADLSGVKIHTDAKADQLNRSIQARAFTTGQDIFFRQGEYDPGSRSGQELIAHESAHVLQQNPSVIQSKIQRQDTGDIPGYGISTEFGDYWVVPDDTQMSYNVEGEQITESEFAELQKRFGEIKKILDTIPTGQEALKLMGDYKVGVKFEAGGGSYYDSSSNSMVIDANESATDAALTFVHEMNHAKYYHQGLSADVSSLSREDYVNKMVEEEAEGTVKSIEAKIELEGTDIDVSQASFPLEQQYREAFKDAVDSAKAKNPDIDEEELKKLGREAGKNRVTEGFMKGEVVTSNTGESYPDYYGQYWDKVHTE